MDQQITSLKNQIDQAIDQLAIVDTAANLYQLQAQSQQPDFWNDSAGAQVIMQQIAKLEAATSPWLNLQQAVCDVSELAGLHDDSLQAELQSQLTKLSPTSRPLRRTWPLRGPYDDHDAL